MKKMIMWSAAIAFVFAAAFVFTQDSSAEPARASGKEVTFNGITVFDQGSSQACGSAAGGKASDDSSMAIQSNGITHFDMGFPGSRVNGSCAGTSSGAAASAWHGNGITVF